MSQITSQKRYAPAHRILICALAAVLALTCICIVALATDPELHTAILSFFFIEEREQVPSGGQDGAQMGPVEIEALGQPYISQTEIGSLVKAQYIKMDQTYGFSGRLLNNLTWSDDHRTLLDAEFWEVEDNKMVPVQVDMRTNQIDVTFQGIHYQGELYWFIRNGELYFFQGCPYGVDTHPEDEWYAEAIPEHTDVLLLKLAQGRQMNYSEYPMLYHLDTNETEDFLAETGADQLEFAYDYSWSENLHRVLILCSVDANGWQEWLCDLDTKTLTRLDELTGMDEEISASFADNDTLVLTTYTTLEHGIWQTVTCYAYDIPTGQKVKTLDAAHYYQWWEDAPYGVQLFGSRCALIDQSGQVRLIDLKTGMQTAIEGFAYQKGDKFMSNPSGNKLLHYVADSKVEGLGVVQLGVIDLEKGTFIAFEREGYEDFYEEDIGWSNDSTVGINARTSDGKTRYRILYTF